MPLGTFTVIIDGNRLGAGTEKTAQVQVRFASGREFVKDTDAGLFWFPHLTNPKPQPVSLPHTVTLVTDVTTGVSTEIGYEIIVTTAAGGTVHAGPFPAQAAGTTIDLTDVTSDFTGTVPEDIALRAETAAAAAEAVGNTNDTIMASRANDDTSAFTSALLKRVAAPRGKTTPGAAAKLPYYNVKDYGAVGDATTDDTAAIQAAATAASGATLFFPTGHYKISATINLPGVINLLGESAKGGSASRLTGTHAGYCFAAPAASNFRMTAKNLHLTCVNGFDLRSTTRTEIGLASFDTVAFGGGDGTGVAINCLNHDFSKITNCGFFWSGVCAIRLSGWYGTGGQKAITAMQVSNNYFGSPLKIGVSADIFESIYCQQNDFGSVQWPVDIGGAIFNSQTDGVSTNYYKRGEVKPTEGYFGVGTNFYFRDNHLENTTCSVNAYGKGGLLKSVHVEKNNDFQRSSTARFARVSGVVQSTFADNEIDFETYTTAECFVYSGCTNLALRDNNYFTRVFDGASNANAYVDAGSNFFTVLRKGISGTAYNKTYTPTMSKVEFGNATGVTTAVGTLAATPTSVHRPMSGTATLAQNATVVLGSYTGRLAGTFYVTCAVTSVGTTASVWTVYEGGATKVSGEASTNALYAITVDTANKQIKLTGLVAGSNVYSAAGFLVGLG